MHLGASWYILVHPPDISSLLRLALGVHSGCARKDAGDLRNRRNPGPGSKKATTPEAGCGVRDPLSPEDGTGHRQKKKLKAGQLRTTSRAFLPRTPKAPVSMRRESTQKEPRTHARTHARTRTHTHTHTHPYTHRRLGRSLNGSEGGPQGHRSGISNSLGLGRFVMGVQPEARPISGSCHSNRHPWHFAKTPAFVPATQSRSPRPDKPRQPTGQPAQLLLHSCYANHIGSWHKLAAFRQKT